MRSSVFIILILSCILLLTSSISIDNAVQEQVNQSISDLSTASSEAELAMQHNKKQTKAQFLNSLIGMNYVLKEVKAKDIKDANNDKKDKKDKKEEKHHHHHHDDEDEEEREEDEEDDDEDYHHYHHRRHHRHHHHHHHSNADQKINITLKLPKLLTKPAVVESPIKTEVKTIESVKSHPPTSLVDVTPAPTVVTPAPTVVTPAPVVVTPAPVVVALTNLPTVSPIASIPVVIAPAPVVVAPAAVKPAALASHCKAGTFFSDAVKHCFPCPPGKGSLDGATTCIDIALLPATVPPVESLCGAGTYLKDGFCAPCPDGMTSGAHAKVCINKTAPKVAVVSNNSINDSKPVSANSKPVSVAIKTNANSEANNQALVAAVAAAIKAANTPKPARRHHKKNKKHNKKNKNKKKKSNGVVDTAKKHPIATAALGATALAGLAAAMSGSSTSPNATVSPSVLAQLKQAISNIKSGNTSKKHKKHH